MSDRKSSGESKTQHLEVKTCHGRYMHFFTCSLEAKVLLIKVICVFQDDKKRHKNRGRVKDRIEGKTGPGLEWNMQYVLRAIPTLPNKNRRHPVSKHSLTA